ncbi:uncharacterized protein K489DRAFT_117449 [Dissoconium aciculare CBS 342.82]|uniref:Uncharacterized protein n=1 Tax=Dissoconium aciculare CBS 342.82 TaxID=1314786 RepID=A0A6J3MES5_9PEZI|nr:uncharacterized protein K489DRAFT_117449 [Dissoconium aciculare CBS 342.82]KAF1826500.1 hypothetical protein K489DRAFT_117449 [Dissoconium aciculare CBS 342.82]
MMAGRHLASSLHHDQHIFMERRADSRVLTSDVQVWTAPERGAACLVVCIPVRHVHDSIWHDQEGIQTRPRIARMAMEDQMTICSPQASLCSAVMQPLLEFWAGKRDWMRNSAAVPCCNVEYPHVPIHLSF